jgi:hypothetical protein
MTAARNYCPSCGAGLVSEPIGFPFKCKSCGWHLITQKEWKKLPPFNQGHALYMQGSWPTSELKGVKNPYAEGTPAWTAFREGEQRAMLSALDGEE